MSSTIVIKKKLADFLVRNIFGHEPCHDFNPTAMGDRLVSLNKRLQSLFNITLNIIPTSTPMTVGGNNHWIDYDESDENAEQDKYKIEKYVNMEEDSTSDILNTTALNSAGRSLYNFAASIGTSIGTYVTNDILSEILNIRSSEVDVDTEEENIFKNTIGQDYEKLVKKFALNNSFNCEDMKRTQQVNTRSTAESVRMCINGIQEIINNIDENRIYVTSHSKTPETKDTRFNNISRFVVHQVGGRIGVQQREIPNIFNEKTNLMPKDDVISKEFVKLK